MEDQRNTSNNQSSRPFTQPPHYADEFPFPPLSPVSLNNIHQIPYNLFPSSIDVDLNLSNALYSLNLSQNNNHLNRRTFLTPSLDVDHGGVGSPISREGFISPVRTNTTSLLNEGFRVSNAVTVNNYPPLISSRFDPRFDFDQRSYLLAKERFHSLQQLNSYDNRSSTYARVSNKLQDFQILSLLPLKELRGMIYDLSRDQNGCRILQSKFQNPTNEDVELVLSEVVGSIADLMKDQFANYLIQQLFPLCTDDQITLIIRELTKPPIQIILVSMSPYGTRAVQKLLENLKHPFQILMVIKALYRASVKLANDPNGHHVLQFCLLNFGSDFNQPILDEIANNCFKVATDRSGCCVLQACVEHSHGEVRNRLVAEIMANALHLAEDPFGNYVLQHMLGLGSPELTQLLVRHLQGNFISLSRNKYASNVVEKCLIESGPELSSKIILELVVGSPNPSILLFDPYGNFVIQSALKVSKGYAHECLRKLISRNAGPMQSNIYGKKILERLEKKKMIHT